MYHADQGHDGNGPTFPSIGNVKPSWNSSAVDGAVYGEPLLNRGTVYVATENNSVYSLNESNGQVIWRTSLGEPVPGTSLPCGDINPSGITSTPVINLKSQEIFVVAFLDGPMPHHYLFALSINNGTVEMKTLAEPSGNFSPDVQQQRSALSISRNGDEIYIPYGGLEGDCGNYHGWIVGMSTINGTVLSSYETPTSREGGIWTPSGLAIDSSGNILAATGNSEATTKFDYGDAVIKLSPDLKVLDYFAPTEWASLNSGDTDLGSVGPMILDANTIFQIGKEGVGYLLNDSNLGRIGGEIYNSSVCDSAFGGSAYFAPYIYVPCTNGLVGLKFAGTSFTVQFTDNGLSDSPITAYGAVWTVFDGNLVAASPTNGTVIFSYPLSNAVHFITPSAGDGRIFVASGSEVLCFTV